MVSRIKSNFHEAWVFGSKTLNAAFPKTPKARWHALLFIALVLGLSISALAQQVRIKDLANIRGFRSNHVVGFGLVIGLNGSGDSNGFFAKNEAAANMLTRLGMQAKPDQISSQSMATVIVTGDLDAFKRNGDKINVKVSTVGDAQSLAGGTLLMTTLRAGDGKIYVVAQGPIVVGQATGQGASVLTTATIPGGGVVEREFKPEIASKDHKISLSLKSADFTTNARVTEKINQHFRGFYAKSIDPVSIEVMIPVHMREYLIEFISELEALKVQTDRKAQVVVNERTGTVVMGSEVAIAPVSISHGSLSIQVDGVAPGRNQKNVVSMGGTTVGKLVESMNALGVKPADLMSILQAIHAAGALSAELKFM